MGLTALVDADVIELPDETVRSELRELLTVANLVQAAIAARVASFDRRDLAHGDGLRTTRAWLCATARLSPYAATGQVRRAKVLADLPALAAACAQGRVTPEHVDKVVNLAEQVGPGAVRQVDHALAELAATGTPGQLRRACDRIRDHADPDGPDPDPAADRRGFTLARSGDIIRLRGQLELDAGATLMTALNALMAPPTGDDLRTPAQRRADALTDLARLSLQSGQLPSVGGIRPHIGLLVTPQGLLTGPVSPDTRSALLRFLDLHGPLDLRDDDGSGGSPEDDRPGGDQGLDDGGTDPLTAAGIPPVPEPPWLDWVGPVPTDTAQRLACDSILYRVIFDPVSGQPLDVGRAYRTAPPWIRKALHARDHGCRWPRCDSPIPYTDAHHLKPWSEGGSTSIDTMLLLCRWHHTTVHEGRWKLSYDAATGEVTVTRPDGTPYEFGTSRRWFGPPGRAA